jgi:D-alanyl-D-alanine carboxypeptidase/D-alanyl-D-alanine-endopeptidase (penicillin-binding protein 4)
MRFLNLLIIFFASFFAISAEADLTTSINHLINHDKRNEKIGIYIQNLQTGSVLYEYNGNASLTPASTAKVFTAAAAYLSLGPNYHYSTTLSTSAKINRTLIGNIYIQFSGDPTLSSNDIYALMHQLRARGVRNIAGNVVLDQSIFSGSYYGEGWTPGDFQRCYGAPIAAAIINSNCSRAGVVKAPNLYAQNMVARALHSAGIRLVGQVIQGATPINTAIIAMHNSDSLEHILAHMLKYSDDVYANAIFKTIGKTYANNGSYSGGSLATSQILIAHLGQNFQPPQLKDGSGLSTLNQISPRQLVVLYNYMYHDPNLAECFRHSLAISGQKGTLIGRLNNRFLAGRVYAKTGTFNHDNGGVSSLAGYLVLPQKGHPVIAFAIMMNNIAGNMSRAHRLQDQIVKAIARNVVL